MKINQDYVQLVLYQINQQLNLHYASLSYALTRPDITVCDVKLGPGTRCLVDCISSLEDQIVKQQEMVNYNIKKCI